MSIVAIIQARMGSTRLPGKVLMDIHGKSMLQHVVERTLMAVREVIVATSWLSEDDVIEMACRNKLPVRVFRGNPTDVLNRYIEAAAQVEARKIIRITADCPLIDPGIICKVADALTETMDYAANIIKRTYPKGLDCEALWFDTLLRVDRMAMGEDREHVTQFIRKRPDLFVCASIEDSKDRSAENWSVDTQGDLNRVRKLHALL